MMKNPHPKPFTLLFAIIVLVLIISITVWAARNLVSVHVTDGLIQYQNGVKVTFLDNKQKMLKIQSTDPVTGVSSSKLIFSTPEDTQERINIPFKLDGYNIELSYCILRKDNKIIPIYKPGEDTPFIQIYPLLPIGESNQYILEYGISLYIIDFDKLNISKFLPDESDGADIKSTQQKNNETSYVYWAAKPQISPDAKLLVYQTNRMGNSSDIRLYNIVTGEDRLLVSDHALGDNVVWNGQESIFIDDCYKLFEVGLTGINETKYLTDIGNSWGGQYPNILFTNVKGQLTWYNCETHEVKLLGVLSPEAVETSFYFNLNSQFPSAVIWQSNSSNISKMDLFCFDTGKLINLLTIEGMFTMHHIQWYKPDTIILAGYAENIEKIYEIRTPLICHAN